MTPVTTEDPLPTLLAVADAITGLVERTPLAERRRVAGGHREQFAIDVTANDLAVRLLTQQGFGVLSEESGRHLWESPIRVVLDPIDGSTNCIRGLPNYGPSLCAVDEAGPVAAVVTNIPAGTTYTARRGNGSTKNGATLTPVVADRLEIVGTGDPNEALEPGVWTRLSGASAHDLCLVAEGVLDGYVDIHNTQSIWDYIGALLILTESGAVVQERAGRALFAFDAVADRQLIAAPSPDLFDQLVRALENSTGGPTPPAGPVKRLRQAFR